MVRVYFDGGVSPNPGVGYGAVVIYDDRGELLVEKAFRIGEKVTNNEAEYGALLAGVRAVTELREKRAVFFGDSKLIVNHVNGSWRCCDEALKSWLARVWKALTELESWRIVWIPREENEHANSIVQRARARNEGPKVVGIDYRARGVDYAREAAAYSYRRAR